MAEAKKEDLERIKLQLQWKHQFEFAGFYAAKEKGFYKDVGLDVEFLEHDNKKSISDKVLDSDADYGLIYSSVIADYYNDKPLVLVANFFKQSPLVLIAQKNIKTPADLVGKKIMGISDSVDAMTILNMLNKFSVKEDDYIKVETDYRLNSFVEKRIDAMSVFTTNELYTLNEMGVEYNLFDPTVYGIKYYDLNLITSKSELRNHPKRVENFRNASIKGWEYALSHKDELVEIIQEKYNSQKKTKKALMFEANQIETIMLPNVYPIGSVDKTRVELITDDFKQAGFIDKNSKKNLENFIYHKAVNNFVLTRAEQEYLQMKKNIKICVDPDWMPFGAIVDDTYVGIDADILKIISKKIGSEITLHKTKSWQESLDSVKTKQCDVISLIVATKEREKYLNITTPYLYYSIVVVTKMDKKNIPDVSYLKNVKVGVVKGYVEIDIIRLKYPNIEVIEVQSIQDGLDKVQNGELYGFADNAFGIDYYFQNSSYSDFKISARFDEKLSLSYGVRSDEIELYTILQKVVDTISKEEKELIMGKWFSTTYKKAYDYALFFKFLIVMSLALLFFIIRHYNIKNLNRELKQRVEEELAISREKDKMIYHQSKLISMGEMIENIAHQWRQPLSQINSAVLVLDDVLSEHDIQDERVENRLLEIESLTNYMSKTITDFRNFYDNDKIKQTFVLNAIINDALNIVKGTLKYHAISVKFSDNEEYKYFGYANELQQVLVVILNNAKDALVVAGMKNAEITIILGKEDGYNTIKICDNAGGIEETIREKIFEPYFTTKHKSQGTGLGLYIAKVIVEESLDGELSMSNKQSGACFKIQLLDSYESRN